MSTKNCPPFMEFVYDLFSLRNKLSKELFALEHNLYKTERRHLSDVQEDRDAQGNRTPEQNSCCRTPLHVDYTFSHSSVTMKTALDLRLRKFTVRMRREERESRLQADASPADGDDSDCSDTDPEMEGLAAFEAAAKRDAELRERFKKEHESHSSKNSGENH
ncbi:unnamed protein product [Haemonchus placei]|uniref:Protein TSSC4 n=1 Tax=Haemonchus placei TaxID=6290 RepID=A0A158QJK4_HAEPC|nr:unnamed protein product [Haemonchus placei]